MGDPLIKSQKIIGTSGFRVEHVSRSACFVHHEEHEGHEGGCLTALRREFFASFGRFALKTSLLRALRVLRGENIFTANPEDQII
jgi:hypothetical protein